MSQLLKSPKCPYPVGALIELAIGANPNTFWHGTTWTEHGTGRAAISLDNTQTEFDVLGKTGGAKNHVMTLNNLIAHTHKFSSGMGATGGLGHGFEWVTDSAEDIDTTETGQAVPEAMPTLPPYIVVARWERTA